MANTRVSTGDGARYGVAMEPSSSSNPTPMHVEPVTLIGQHIRLEPLSMNSHGDLCDVGLDRDLWRWTIAEVLTPEDMRAYVQTALQWQQDGTALPFVT